jgi:hypothetical protein
MDRLGGPQAAQRFHGMQPNQPILMFQLLNEDGDRGRPDFGEGSSGLFADGFHLVLQ